MTRQFGFFSALIVVAASLWQAPASADSLWAEKTGWVDYGFGQLQHTYVCYRSGSKKSCYGNPGGNSGGSYLSRTSGVGSGSKVVCAKGGSCAIRWGFTGTCHQGANRMLKTASKTVSAAGGYSISVRLFGTYGPATSWNYCRAYCGI